MLVFYNTETESDRDRDGDGKKHRISIIMTL